MRIALIVERFGPRGGGVEAAAWNSAHALARARHDVCVLAREGPDETAALDGIRVRRLRAPRQWQPIRVAAFSRAAAAASREDDFDVVHSFSRTRHQNVYRAGAGSHADFMARTYTRLGCGLRQLSPRHRTLLGMEARVFADARQLVQCVSNGVREEIARRHRVPNERLAVLYNGVDHGLFDRTRHASEAAALRRERGGGGPIWLFAGSGGRRKGLDTALEALAQSRQRDARLWVAGRDEPRPWRALASRLGVAKRVDFLGARDDMPILYAAADVLLLPTRYDPFANVCLEAAASSLPVVTSASNGAAEILGEAGRIVRESEDARAFAAALDTFSSPESRQRAGASGRALARRHDWASHADALSDLYGRAIELAASAARGAVGT